MKPYPHRTRARSTLLPIMLLASLASAVAAEDEVWLVGGGPDVFSSQVQIEANLLWAQRVITRLPSERRVAVWFTDGNDPARDVVEWRPPEESTQAWQPLAREFDYQWSNGETYRNHRVSGSVGSTEAPRLRADLEQALRRLAPEDAAWLNSSTGTVAIRRT